MWPPRRRKLDTMKTQFGAAVLVALTLATAPGQVFGQDGEATISSSSGVYSEEQAKRGSDVFGDVCLACHDVDEFQAGYFEAWAGETAYELFDQLRNTMPEDAPGSLRSREYADLLAYLFAINSVPSGEVELDSDADALRRIILEVPEPTPAENR